MEDFAVNADAMEKVVEEIRVVFNRVMVIRREDFKVGTVALTQIKNAVKELITLFKEAQEKVEIR